MSEIKFRAVTREGYVIQDIGKIEFFEDGTIIVNDEFPVKELIQSEVKEPWEMTRREFNQGIMPKRIKQRTAFHKKLIQEALSEGKPVPPEVLKDYRGKMTIKPTETIKCREEYRMRELEEDRDSETRWANEYFNNWQEALTHNVLLKTSLNSLEDEIKKFLNYNKTITQGGYMDNFKDVARARKGQYEIIDKWKKAYKPETLIEVNDANHP